MFDISCIIFAGGKSSRMGKDKALLAFANVDTLIEYQYARLSKIFKNVYISAKSAGKFPSHLQQYVIDDVDSEVFAPTTGFLAIFNRLSDEKFFIISVDTPFVGLREIERIVLAQSKEIDAILAQTREKEHYLCGIYKRSLLPSFEKMLENNEHRLGKLIQSSRVEYVFFENEDAFMNLNTPDQYKKAKMKILKS